MPTLGIFIGNIGTGKSTIAAKLAKKGSVVFNMDSYQQMLAGGEYGAYDEQKKDIYRKGEEATISVALDAGLSVVVDRTNMDRKRRERFIRLGQQYGAKITAWDFGIGHDNYSLGRRLKHPHGIPARVWFEVSARMARSYDPPSLDEGFSEIIKPPTKFSFHAFDFDGTIVENRFPQIGEIIPSRPGRPSAVEMMNRLFEDLSNIIIVWSCRSGDYENEMRHFLFKNKIPFDFINQNPLFEPGSRKIYADIYYDDRGITCPSIT